MTKRVPLIKDARCGTYAGAQAHAKHGEYLCSRCRPVYLDYHRRQALHQNRARQRVLIALRGIHTPEYQALYAVHRSRAIAEAEGLGVSSKRLLNRARQRALTELGKNHAPQYRRLMTEELMRILMEEG